MPSPQPQTQLCDAGSQLLCLTRSWSIAFASRCWSSALRPIVLSPCERRRERSSRSVSVGSTSGASSAGAAGAAGAAATAPPASPRRCARRRARSRRRRCAAARARAYRRRGELLLERRGRLLRRQLAHQRLDLREAVGGGGAAPPASRRGGHRRCRRRAVSASRRAASPAGTPPSRAASSSPPASERACSTRRTRRIAPARRTRRRRSARRTRGARARRRQRSAPRRCTRAARGGWRASRGEGRGGAEEAMCKTSWSFDGTSGRELRPVRGLRVDFDNTKRKLWVATTLCAASTRRRHGCDGGTGRPALRRADPSASNRGVRRRRACAR